MKVVSQLKAMNLHRQITYLEDRFIKITPPKNILKSFSQIVGMESEKAELSDAIRYLKNLEIYQKNPLTAPYSRYLMAGEPGSGKTILVSSIAKEAKVPLIKVDMSSFVSFPDEAIKLLDKLFKVIVALKKGCVVHLQNFSAMNALPEEISMLFHNNLTQKIAECINAVIILSTIENQIKLPSMYFSPNVFLKNKVIQIQTPTLATREALFKEYLKKYNVQLADDVDAERLARNTLGMYPKDLEFIARETKLYAERNKVSPISLKEFNDVMLNMIDTQTHAKMTEKERRSTAYHEAGHVIAAYFSNPNYVLGRVEITPRSASLGLTQEEASEERYTMFRSDYEKEIIYCFGGMAAEEFIYNETSSGVAADLASASTYACAMFNKFGMSKEIGPIYLDCEYGLNSDTLYDASEIIIQNYLKELYKITINIIKEHALELNTLANKLLEKEVLTGKQIQEILDLYSKNDKRDYKINTTH